MNPTTPEKFFASFNRRSRTVFLLFLATFHSAPQAMATPRPEDSQRCELVLKSALGLMGFITERRAENYRNLDVITERLEKIERRKQERESADRTLAQKMKDKRSQAARWVLSRIDSENYPKLATLEAERSRLQEQVRINSQQRTIIQLFLETQKNLHNMRGVQTFAKTLTQFPIASSYFRIAEQVWFVNIQRVLGEEITDRQELQMIARKLNLVSEKLSPMAMGYVPATKKYFSDMLAEILEHLSNTAHEQGQSVLRNRSASIRPELTLRAFSRDRKTIEALNAFAKSLDLGSNKSAALTLTSLAMNEPLETVLTDFSKYRQSLQSLRKSIPWWERLKSFDEESSLLLAINRRYFYSNNVVSDYLSIIKEAHVQSESIHKPYPSPQALLALTEALYASPSHGLGERLPKEIVARYYALKLTAERMQVANSFANDTAIANWVNLKGHPSEIINHTKVLIEKLKTETGVMFFPEETARLISIAQRSLMTDDELVARIKEANTLANAKIPKGSLFTILETYGQYHRSAPRILNDSSASYKLAQFVFNPRNWAVYPMNQLLDAETLTFIPPDHNVEEYSAKSRTRPKNLDFFK